jgi:hypothetical protein
VVVADTHGRIVDRVLREEVGGQLHGYWWWEYNAGFNCWGHPQRNFAMPRCSGQYITNLDDDDVWAADASTNILAALAEDVKPALHIFRMIYPDGRGLWADPEPRFGNVGTPMMVFPNDPDLYGSWGRAYEGDFLFLQMTLANMGLESIKWHPEVIALIDAAEVKVS